MHLTALVAGNVLLAVGASSVLKATVATLDDGKPAPASVAVGVLLALLLNASSFLLLFFLLQRADIAVCQVLISSSVMLTATGVGVVVFGEPVTPLRGAAVALALGAVGVMYAAASQAPRMQRVPTHA